MKRKKPYEVEFIYRPGLFYSNAELKHLVDELCNTASSCFDELPDYQIMRKTRKELSDKIITVAWRDDGKIEGFCSCVLLPVEGIGKVFHLGLTCVRPEHRGSGLTHLLTSKVVINYLLRYKPFGKTWVSNCACVLSSLGNVAIHFDDIYPSPFYKTNPTKTHKKIAKAIDTDFRDKMYVMPDAILDEDLFVFRSSVKETVFQKDKNDGRFQHRLNNFNDYYSDLLDFENGDEALQIGTVSLFSGIRYMLKKRKLKIMVQAPKPRLA